MGEISIDPKFNIHETYKKVRILNPYRNGAAQEAETTAYSSRVVADGGIITDINYVDSIYKKLKELGILGNLVYWNSANAGVKTNGSKLYSLDPNSNDANQSNSSLTPLFQNSNVNVSKKSIYFNDKILTGTLPAFSSSAYTLIDLSVFTGTTRTTQHGLTEGTTDGTYFTASIEYWDDYRTVVFNGDGSNFESEVFAFSQGLNVYATRSLRKSGTSLVYDDKERKSTSLLQNNYSTLAKSYSIGRRSVGGTGNPMIGEINEAICFNINLTDSQNFEIRNLIDNYYS